VQPYPFVRTRPSAALSGAALLFLTGTILWLIVFGLAFVLVGLIILLTLSFGPGDSSPGTGLSFVLIFVGLFFMVVLGALGTNAIYRRTSYSRAVAIGWLLVVLNGSIAVMGTFLGSGTVLYKLCLWAPFLMFMLGLVLVHGHKNEFSDQPQETWDGSYRLG
jgi:hypothetical protein